MFASPIVSAVAFVPMSSVASWGESWNVDASTWSAFNPDAFAASSLATPNDSPIPMDQRARSRTVRRAAPATASVIAWRAAYYAFRHARTCIAAGRTADALAYLAGPQGDYVRRRFAELAATDDRYASALAILAREPLPPTDQRAPVAIACEPTTSASVAPAVAPDIAAPDLLSGKMIVNRLELRRALRQVLATIPDRVTITDGVETIYPALRLTASDEKGPLCVWVDPLNTAPARVAAVQVDEPFDVVLERGYLLERIATLENCDTLSISVERSGDNSAVAHIRSSDAHYQLFANSPRKRVETPAAIRPAVELATTAGELARALRTVAFAAAKSNTRYAFASIALDVVGTACDVVATDGRRIMTTRLAATYAGDESPVTALIPMADVKSLRKVLAATPKTAVVHLTIGAIVDEKRTVRVTGDAIGWTSCTKELTYVDWRSYLVVDAPTAVYAVEVAELATTIRAGGANASDALPCVRITCTSPDTLTCASKSAEFGSSSAGCFAALCSPQAFAAPIGFNRDLLAQPLDLYKSGPVRVELEAPNRPARLTFEDGSRYILMPINLD